VSGRASGMTRTTIGYRKLSDAAMALARDPRIAGNRDLVALLQARAQGLGRLDDAHFISGALRSGAIGQILARGLKDSTFLPRMLRQMAGAARRRLQRG